MVVLNATANWWRLAWGCISDRADAWFNDRGLPTFGLLFRIEVSDEGVLGAKLPSSARSAYQCPNIPHFMHLQLFLARQTWSEVRRLETVFWAAAACAKFGVEAEKDAAKWAKIGGAGCLSCFLSRKRFWSQLSRCRKVVVTEFYVTPLMKDLMNHFGIEDSSFADAAEMIVI